MVYVLKFSHTLLGMLAGKEVWYKK